MKVTYRIPTDQYAYIEVEQELSTLDAFLINENYKELTGAFKESTGDGLTSKEIDAMLDSYFLGKGVDSNEYDRLNEEQRKWVQAVKRSLARIKNKSNGDTDIL